MEEERERIGGRLLYETQYETATTTYTNVDRPHKKSRKSREHTNLFAIINTSARARKGTNSDEKRKESRADDEMMMMMVIFTTKFSFLFFRSLFSVIVSD
jgi:hypothetical protein